MIFIGGLSVSYDEVMKNAASLTTNGLKNFSF